MKVCRPGVSMDHGHRVVVSFVVLLGAGAVAAFGVGRYWPGSQADTARGQFPDLSSASVVEIRDVSRRPLLEGRFELSSTTSASVLKTAQLLAEEGEGVGKVEIELVRHPNGAMVQELEVDVDGLPTQAAFAVLVDGVHTGWLRTDALGAGEFERYGRVTTPVAASSAAGSFAVASGQFSLGR